MIGNIIMPVDDHNNEREILNQVVSYSEQVRKEAIAIDNLPNGALAGFFTGSIAIGAIFGGVWWVPAAIAAGPVLLRVANFIMFYREEKQIKLNEIRDRKTRSSIALAAEIQNSCLPNPAKEQSIKQLFIDNEIGTAITSKVPVMVSQNK